MQFQLLDQEGPASTERGLLILQEFGSLLQIDLTAMLNSTQDRPRALNQYLESLKAATQVAKEVQGELEEKIDSTKDQIKDLKKSERAAKKEVKRLFDEEDFAAGGAKQNELSEIELQLAKMESEEDRTEDTLGHYENLTGIADKRIEAIKKNREVLIAGLKVVDIPGVDDLEILMREKRGFFRRR